jgi:lipopolysaccharide/colanic/teichoic acid biosynthesis glycosyltransferase
MEYGEFMRQDITFDISPTMGNQAVFPMSERRRLYFASKRILDFVFALLALISLFPVMILVAILIKLDSSGPIFFKQDRVSVRQKSFNKATYLQRITFRCYKFRTMICNADPAIHKSYIKALIDNDPESMAALQGGDTQTRKLTHDPRVTRLGRILRKSSLDEIPQFINVLKGEMSLVGPRPAIPYELEMYKPWHFKRLETKPGITGLWQVTARSTADFDEIVKLDIQYIERQSFLMDLEILLKTPYAVISCKGAV